MEFTGTRGNVFVHALPSSRYCLLPRAVLAIAIYGKRTFCPTTFAGNQDRPLGNPPLHHGAGGRPFYSARDADNAVLFYAEGPFQLDRRRQVALDIVAPLECPRQRTRRPFLGIAEVFLTPASVSRHGRDPAVKVVVVVTLDIAKGIGLHGVG